MKRAPTVLTLLVTALLLTLPAFALAQGPPDDRPGEDARKAEGRGEDAGRPDDAGGPDHERGKPAFVEAADKWILRNDQMSVWFHRNPAGLSSPQLRVLMNGTDGNQTGYKVHLLKLYEAEDENLTFRGSLNWVNLARAQQWDIRTQEDNGTLHLYMRLDDPQAAVTFAFHLDTVSAAVKFDLGVENWQWAESPEDHRLVFDILVNEERVEAAGERNLSVDGGYVNWEPNATATYGANDTRTLSVVSTLRDGEGDGEGTHLLLAFEGPGGYEALDYDPTLGVQSAGNTAEVDTPGPGALAAVAAVAVASVAAARRRR